MVPVINPSGSAGHSFKGLHAYLSHDKEQTTSERLEWMETRNIATNDPVQAWKIMAATARAQNDIKRGAGVRTGKAPKDGAVMHVVLSFADGEPMSREAIAEAADEFLSQLGVDPAKMRSKNKPSRRQFAEEHQTVMYAHTDTENTHVHLMINRIHPETGIVLPSNNDQLKAQKWALEYSKRHGTDHLTPARKENRDMRENGEYVKADRRKSRNVYEQEKTLQGAANDNDHVRALREQQRKKDTALALRGRNLTRLQDAAWDKLAETHKYRKAALARDLQKKTNLAKAETREEYRPKWRDLRKDQESEKVTFAELEKSFFGRAANAAKLSADLVREQRSGVIARTFRIISNAGARKEFFDRAQQRAQSTLQREQAAKAHSRTQDLKAAQAAKMAANRAVFSEQREDLAKTQAAARQKLKDDWKERTVERAQALQAVAKERGQDRKPQSSDADMRMLNKYKSQFEQSAEQPTNAAEQDNEREIDIADDD